MFRRTPPLLPQKCNEEIRKSNEVFPLVPDAPTGISRLDFFVTNFDFFVTDLDFFVTESDFSVTDPGRHR
jgi:hypothetical protein